MTFRKFSIAYLAPLLLIAQTGRADVKTEEKTKVEFTGMLGGFMKVFGGKSAKEGIVNKVAVKGERKMTTNEDTAELVDLSEEKVYQIDLKKKTYSVVTFAQMRQQMEDALAKAKQQAASQPPPEAPKPDPKAQPQQTTEFAIDFKLQDSGQKKVINGFNCHEVVATITVRPKDKPAQDGSLVLTTSMWMSTPRIAAMKELEDFDRRYAQKLALQFDKEMVEQMRPAMAQYPGLGVAMGKLEIEKVKMDGTPVLTVMGFEAVVPPDQTADGKPASTAPTQPPPQQKSTVPTSIGGLIGGLGKKAAPKEEPSSSSSSKPGSIMTTNHELVSVSTSVVDADISIPAGFKEKK